MIIDHHGITVKNLNYARKIHIERYNYFPITDELIIENQGVIAQILSNNSGVNLELLTPYGDNSPIKSFIRRGIGLAHICFKIKDFENEYNRLKRWVVREPKVAPKTYFNSGRTFFVHNGIYLIEYLECMENEK